MIEKKILEIIKSIYPSKTNIPLHEPFFDEGDYAIVADTVKSSFVSSVGEHVINFEKNIAEFTNSKMAVVTSNGTSALHVTLYALGVSQEHYVLTQALSFVATSNAIRHCGADPIFIDINKDTLGMCPDSLSSWLDNNAELNDRNECIYKVDGRIIKACLPMHTFGHALQIDKLISVCEQWKLPLIEDSAEALGTNYANQSVGTFGKAGIFSFNGNKIITTGGGGAIITNDEEFGRKIKHLSTTAKILHPYNFYHDEVGFNYRMPNLNAALGVSQLKKLASFLETKREIANYYRSNLENEDVSFVVEPNLCKSNYWLNTIICNDEEQKTNIIEFTNSQGVNTRPAWKPLNTLPMFNNLPKDELSVTEWAYKRIVNLPSSFNGYVR